MTHWTEEYNKASSQPRFPIKPCEDETTLRTLAKAIKATGFGGWGAGTAAATALIILSELEYEDYSLVYHYDREA